MSASLTFSADGKALLACGDYEPFVYEWDVATGRLHHEIALRDDITPFGLAFTPTARRSRSAIRQPARRTSAAGPAAGARDGQARARAADARRVGLPRRLLT